MTETPEETRLRALSDQLRAHAAEMKAELSPEVLENLTDDQRRVLREELEQLRNVSRRVLHEIGAHIGLTYSITVRPATQDELERCGVTSQADLIDGAFAVLRDGGLIALTNEYGTAVWTDEGVDKGRAEIFVENATGLWT